MDRDPPRTGPRHSIQSDNTGIVAGFAIAAIVALALLVMWPRGEGTSTAMRDSSPRVERAPSTPQSPPPAKPQ
jgi:hypothetical protein